MNWLTNNEIAVNNFSSARRLAEDLLENNYVVMISKEENLFIVNYVWSKNADRNDIAFNNRETIEDIIFDREEEKND